MILILKIILWTQRICARACTETSVSLNEAKRRKQMEEAEKKKASGKLDTKLTSNKEGLPQDELLKLNDEFLREGLLILTELVRRG